MPTQLVLALLGMGATLALADFAQIVKNPRALVLGLVIQLVLVPLLAVVFIAVFGLDPGWAVGLVLIAVVPSGALGNLMTFIGRGNVALAISVTSVTTLGSVITIPLLLRLLAASHLPSDFVFPTAKIIGDVCLFLLLPLVLGMVVRRVAPLRASTFSKACVGASLLMLLTVTISALGSGRIRIAEHGWVPPALIVLFAVTLVVMTPLLCRLLRRPDEEALALAVGTNVRNMGVALFFVATFFPGQPEQGHVLYSVLFYAGLSGPSAIMAMLRHRRGKALLPFLRTHSAPTAAAKT